MGFKDIINSITKRNVILPLGVRYDNGLTEEMTNLMIPSLKDSGKQIYLEEVGDSNWNINIKLTGVDAPIGIVKRNKDNGSVSHIQIFTGIAAPLLVFPRDCDINEILSHYEGSYMENVPNPCRMPK